jgi:hypothetical protein
MRVPLGQERRDIPRQQGELVQRHKDFAVCRAVPV